MSETLTIVMFAGGGAALLVIAAAGLLAWEASHRHLASRVQHVVHTDTAGTIQPGRTTGSVVFAAVQKFGEALRSSAVFSERNIADLERTALAAGLDPRSAVPVVIGGKIALVITGPILAYALTSLAGSGMAARFMAVAIAFTLGMMGPNWILDWLRRSHTADLRRGLPDALDLLVVCAESGLGLESAIDRVTAEMRASSPATAYEFSILAYEMRMSSDRSGALARMGERTEVESFQRLVGTLAQTLRFGTPLGQALRILAAEMRNERLIRLEERAAKLPALLTLPLILFILPCLFIVLAGPAAIRVLNVLAR